MVSADEIERLREREREYDDEVIGDGTLVELFDENTRRYSDSDAQLYKGGVYDRSLTPDVISPADSGEYASITYGEMGDIVRRLAAGFRELGVQPGDRVSMFSGTRMEWAVSDFALLAAGGVVSTVYKESGPRQVNYLVNHPGSIGVVCENETLLDRVVKIHSELDLAFVVVFDELDKYADVDGIHSLADVYELGADRYDRATYESWLDDREPEDLASLIYTSGTTGIPKGVELTHRNFRANVNQIRRRSGPRPDKGPDVPAVTSDTRTLSFLPLAHVFERTVGHFFMFACGATVGYAESPDTVGEDIAKVQPNAAASVPRVYERIFDQMREEAGGSAAKERIFGWATDVARRWARTEEPSLGLRVRHAVADALVFSDVKEQLGGEIEYLVSGGGTLSKELSELFLGMGIPIYEGYGLTEGAPVVTSNFPEAPRPGTLGAPVTGVDVRLDESSVDDDFDDTDNRVGELLFKGPNVTDGYWKMPEKTESAFTDDGYFKTGDIVEETPDGHLRYEDRLKNLLVLTTGKNVSPEPIEGEFATSPQIEQIMVIGDDRKFVAALIVPDFEQVRQWAGKRDVDLPDSEEAICEDERVREWINEEVQLVNREFGLDSEAAIKQFELVATEWTADNDLLTPSLKKKRRNILSAFEDRVDRIYGETNSAETAAGPVATAADD
ncbi:AMP-dependent synthetase/ligase [Halorientalis salina]|uniref:AMP-dependent synthetase/ligase n=1 Tax=Halorientalis salina TaxID=2932266 RepID=UPI0010AC6206|nr:long-chain fatty acid--CoA ligase [Halorientalis salina]